MGRPHSTPLNNPNSLVFSLSLLDRSASLLSLLLSTLRQGALRLPFSQPLLAVLVPPLFVFNGGSPQPLNLDKTEAPNDITATPYRCLTNSHSLRYMQTWWKPAPVLCRSVEIGYGERATQPTCHQGGDAWTHAPSLVVIVMVFSLGLCGSAYGEAFGRKKIVKTTFIGGAWPTRATSLWCLIGY